VLVAWKDSREARRAALDALPLLETADHVTVVEVAREDDEAAVNSAADRCARMAALIEAAIAGPPGRQVIGTARFLVGS
jgi:hypothetical protein